MFSAVSVQLKREGFGGIDHYPPIDEEHLTTIYDSLSDIDPVSLQQKVFVDVLLYFGRRGRENLRDLKKSDFEMCTKKSNQGGGDVEHTYIRIKKDELTKNHRNDKNTAVGKMYEVKGDLRCPVRTFRKYVSKLNDKCEYFFQRPKKIIKDDSLWYDASPIGHNIIGGMMPAICEKAGLDIRYTNHSLRATTVHLLDIANIPGRHIMSVTGHKSENSLKTYTGFTCDRALQNMSNIISDGLRSQTASAPTCTSSYNQNVSDMNIKTSHVATENEQDIVAEFENDHDLVDFHLFSDSQMETLVQSVTSHTDVVPTCTSQALNLFSDSQMETLVQSVTSHTDVVPTCTSQALNLFSDSQMETLVQSVTSHTDVVPTCTSQALNLFSDSQMETLVQSVNSHTDVVPTCTSQALNLFSDSQMETLVQSVTSHTDVVPTCTSQALNLFSDSQMETLVQSVTSHTDVVPTCTSQALNLFSDSQMETLVQSVNSHTDVVPTCTSQALNLFSDSQMETLVQSVNSHTDVVPTCTSQALNLSQINNTSNLSYNGFPSPPTIPSITNNYGNVNINYNIIPK